jgi:kynurenine formamidase
VKLVGVDSATVDHPLATSLGPHRNGPQIRDLPQQYKDATGKDAKKDFPDWNVAHKTLLKANIPTIENCGGDIDEVTGKRATFHAYPWLWRDGDACVIRLVAFFDITGNYRLESGERVVG